MNNSNVETNEGQPWNNKFSKGKPILCSADEIARIQSDGKVLLRRSVKWPVKLDRKITTMTERSVAHGIKNGFYNYVTGELIKAAPIQVGDCLWVRETYKYADWTEDGEPFIEYRAGGVELIDFQKLPYFLTTYDDESIEKISDEIWCVLSTEENIAIDGLAADRKWRPPMSMPRCLTRIWLDVVNVSVENNDGWEWVIEVKKKDTPNASK